MSIQILQPPHLARPSGYSPGVLAVGRHIYVSGQLGWNEHHEFASDRLCDQVRDALKNVLMVLRQAQAGPQHLAKLTWFIVDFQQYQAQLKEIGIAYRETIGNHYPAMSMVQVAALLEPAAQVEIEAVAVLPEPGK